MDASSTAGATFYWPRQDNMQNPKSIIKLAVEPQVTAHYGGAVQYYSNSEVTSASANNTLKRSLSGTGQQGSPFKKRNFTQSVAPSLISTSVVHTDEEDDDDDEEGDSNAANVSASANGKNSLSKRDDNRRRAAHTAAEQKRRNAIRKGYDALQSLVPNSHLLDPISSQKVSKAAILKRSTDHLVQLNKEKQQMTIQLESKKKDIYCLRAVQKTYEDILEMNLNSSKNASASIDDEHKFKVFQNIADSIFLSFDQAMEAGQVSNFANFTSAVLRWVEDSCRPGDISEVIRRAAAGNYQS